MWRINNSTMIEWHKLLTSENFYNDPSPHYRIFNVLPDDVHSELNSSYIDIRDKMKPPFGHHSKGQNLQCELWQELLEDFWNSSDVLHKSWVQMTNQDLPDDHNVHSVNFSSHPPKDYPGKLLKDWHTDGPEKKLSYIYYLGDGDETHGNFELSNHDISRTKDYPYQANSMIIWYNDFGSNHRFRQSNNIRKTVYVSFS